MGADDCLEWPGWRSLLFVPAGNRRVVEKADSRGADALILDLEDAIAGAEKAAARAAVPERVSMLTGQNAHVLVRVNAGVLDLVHDLEACVGPGLSAVIVPKAEQPERLALVDELLTALESDAAMPARGIGIIALVETAKGLLAAPELARATPRVMALALGPEDMALDLGGEPDAELLVEPARRLVWAARAAGRTAVGFPGAISNFSDLSRLTDELFLARRLGFAAALCIHPRQLEACHRAFSVADAEADHAQRVLDAFAAAQREGDGVCALDGQMIDRPVARRAEAVLARWRKQDVRGGSA